MHTTERDSDLSRGKAVLTETINTECKCTHVQEFHLMMWFQTSDTHPNHILTGNNSTPRVNRSPERRSNGWSSGHAPQPHPLSLDDGVGDHVVEALQRTALHHSEIRSQLHSCQQLRLIGDRDGGNGTQLEVKFNQSDWSIRMSYMH